MDQADGIALSGGETLEFADARGATLIVRHGTLWVTHQRTRRDVTLRAGDAWTIECGGSTLVTAKGNAAFGVIGRSLGHVRVLNRRLRLAERFARWFDSLADRPRVRRNVPYY